MIKTFLYSLLLSFLPLSAAAGDELACYQESASGIIADISTGQNIQPRLYNGKELDRTNNLFWYDFGARQYDAPRGQFTNPDRFREKYYALNPYSFSANNPINIIDINGDSLWISYKGNSYLYQDGSLFNKDGSVYNEKLKGFLKSTINALADLEKTMEGSSLIEELQNSANIFTIKSYRKNKFEADNIRKAGANLAEVQLAIGDKTGSSGSGGVILWNAHSTDGGLNLKGYTNRPAYIGLGHEMAHASDANNGLLHFANDYRSYQSKHNGLFKFEWRAVYRENLIRSQAGIPLRTHYGVDLSNGFPVGIGPRLLTPSNLPINY